MKIQTKLASLILALPMLLVGCSNDEGGSTVSAASEPATSSSSDEAYLDDTTLQPVTNTSTTCQQNLTKYPNVALACQKIDELKKKYAGKDIVIAAIGAVSDGALGGYVVYDYSDLKDARTTKVMPAPLEKQTYASETAEWGTYGVAAIGIYATDAVSLSGYAYGTAGYGPTGGFILMKSSTPKTGKRSIVIPLVW